MRPSRSRPPAKAEIDDLVRIYLDDIGQYPLLTKDDEARLGRRIEAGLAARSQLEAGDVEPDRRQHLAATVADGDEATVAFVNANLRLVVAVARPYRSSGVPFLDVIQDGNIGLIHAVEKFDWRKGFKFSTYATWWIRQSIQRGLTNTRRTIRLPLEVENRLRNVLRARDALDADLGRPPTLSEIARETGLSEDTVTEALDRNVHIRSLAEPLTSDSATQLGEMLSDATASDPSELALTALVEHDVQLLLQALEPRERHLLRLRFGMDGGTERATAEIAAELHISADAVRALEGRALAKLRHPSTGYDAAELLAG